MQDVKEDPQICERGVIADISASGERFIDAEEASRFLGGLNSRTVVRWAREGYVPAYPIGEGKRRLWRFLETDLEAWMLARRSDGKGFGARVTLWSAIGVPVWRCMTESTRFQQGSLMRVKNKRTPDTWFFRYYEDQEGKRVHRNLKIGSVLEMPLRKDAEKAVLSMRAKINSEVRTPETVLDLITHYTTHELTPERKSHATLENYGGNLRLYILPKWGQTRLSGVRTVAVEAWLHSLPLAPATRSKIRNQMSAVFTHGIRHEFITTNPISKVRTSAARLREPDVLTPEEFRSLLPHLPLRERAMVMLAGSTGLRRSEMFALRWSDICQVTLQVFVTKGIVRNHMGNVKTPASRKPVPLHTSVLAALNDWRCSSPYGENGDFLFPSVRLKGTQPLFPDMILYKIIRPAIAKAGIAGKVIGWHSFRHSLATNLRSMGVDVKTAQELLRHANSRITLDLYTRAVSSDKREASGRQIEMLMGGSNSVPSSVPSVA